MKKICFTGHRRIKDPRKVYDRLIVLLEELIQEGVEEFFAGGAIGFDSISALAVIQLRSKYTNIKLRLVLPCSNEEQTFNWTRKQKTEFMKILSAADSVEYTSEHYTDDCMKKRNARLVEHGEGCICYYLDKFKTGTGQTIRMAAEKGIPVYNLADAALGL